MKTVTLFIALGAALCACGCGAAGEPLATCANLRKTALDKCTACEMDSIDSHTCALYADDVADACFDIAGVDACNGAIGAGDCSPEGLWPAACDPTACGTGGSYEVSIDLEVISGSCAYDTDPFSLVEEPGEALHPDPNCVVETDWDPDGCRVFETRDCTFPGIGDVNTEETIVFLPSGDHGWGGVLTTIRQESGQTCEARSDTFHARI